jgi:hypothetical protein
MPARNIHHDTVIQALEADGWTITHDPLPIAVGERHLFVDLGAERSTIGAERGDERIAVEIQTFGSPSPVHDLESALGQFVLYRALLARSDPGRTLFLGLPHQVVSTLLAEPLGQVVIANVPLRIVVFDPQEKKVVRWIS